MYLPESPSHLTSPMKRPMQPLFGGGDCFGFESSSSKKPSSKRKAQSINNMIRKVEQEIINSESHLQQIEHDTYEHQFPHQMQTQPQYFQQQPSSPYLISTSATNTSLSPRPPQYPQQRLQFSSAKNSNNSSHSNLHVAAVAAAHSNEFFSGIDVNTTGYTSQCQSASASFISTHHSQPFQQQFQSQQPQQNSSKKQYQHSQIFPETFVTMREFKAILKQQLAAQEANIVSQVSSCLKQSIIPEIKRQVLQDLEQKKAEIDGNLKRAMSDSNDISTLNAKLSNLKQSFERSKEQGIRSPLPFNATRDSIEQKISQLCERISFIEDHVVQQVQVFEEFKQETTQVITDFKDTRRRQARAETLIETLSNTLIAMEYSTKKNYEEITAKISELESTEEIPFVTQSDRYQRSLIEELQRNVLPQQQNNENNSQQPKKQPAFLETQLPYTNNSISVNLKHVDSSGKKTTILQSLERNSFDILPDLSNHKQSSKKDGQLNLQEYTTPFKFNQINESIALQEQKNAFNYEYNSNRKSRPVVMVSSNTVGKSNQKQERDFIPPNAAQCMELNTSGRGLTHSQVPTNSVADDSGINLSSEINYVNKKGLPQIFPFVESTTFEANEITINQQNHARSDSENSQHIVQSKQIAFGESDINNRQDTCNQQQEPFLVSERIPFDLPFRSLKNNEIVKISCSQKSPKQEEEEKSNNIDNLIWNRIADCPAYSNFTQPE